MESLFQRFYISFDMKKNFDMKPNETEIVTLRKILTIGVNTYVCFILPQVGEKIKLIINQKSSLKLMRLTSFGYPE